MNKCELKINDLAHIYFWTRGIQNNMIVLREVCKEFGMVYDPTMTGKQSFYGWSNDGTEVGQCATPQVFCTTEYSLRQHFERATGKNKHRTNFSVFIENEVQWMEYWNICKHYGFECVGKLESYKQYHGVQHSQHKTSSNPFGMAFQSIGKFHQYCKKYFSPLDIEAYPNDYKNMVIPPEPFTLKQLFSSYCVEISDSQEMDRYRKFCKSHSVPWSNFWKGNSKWYGFTGTKYSGKGPSNNAMYKFRAFSELEDMTHTIMEKMDIVDLCYLADTDADARYYLKQAKEHHIPIDSTWSGDANMYYGVIGYENHVVAESKGSWCQYYDRDTFAHFIDRLNNNSKTIKNDTKRPINTESTRPRGIASKLSSRARQNSAASRYIGNAQKIGRVRAKFKIGFISASAIKL